MYPDEAPFRIDEGDCWPALPGILVYSFVFSLLLTIDGRTTHPARLTASAVGRGIFTRSHLKNPILVVVSHKEHKDHKIL